MTKGEFKTVMEILIKCIDVLQNEKQTPTTEFKDIAESDWGKGFNEGFAAGLETVQQAIQTWVTETLN